jgi:DivIVA domain-containing protein
MSLSSQDVVNKSFQNVRRGYDPDEVNAFLEEIAAKGVSGKEGAKTQDPGVDLDDAVEEIRTIVRAAREAAAKLKESSEKEAQAMFDEAGDKAADVRRSATQEATETLEDARKRAQQLVEEAKAYAEEQRSMADRERDKVLDGAMRHHEQLMAQERELQEAANRAEKALFDLRSALKSEQGPGPEQISPPGVAGSEKGSSKVINLKSQDDAEERERGIRR